MSFSVFAVQIDRIQSVRKLTTDGAAAILQSSPEWTLAKYLLVRLLHVGYAADSASFEPFEPQGFGRACVLLAFSCGIL